VKLCLGPLGGDVVAELPFVLMHPKPEETNNTNASKVLDSNTDGDANNDEQKVANVDTNLIQLDT